MKKIALAVLFSALYVLSLAQPQPLLSPWSAGEDQQNIYEQIQSAKIAFFTAELELSPKEAE